MENSEAPMPNRSEAADAATPSEVRWNTATTYAASATAQTSQARRGVVAGPDGAGGVVIARP